MEPGAATTGQPGPIGSAETLEGRLAELRSGWGIEFPAAGAVLAHLAQAGAPVAVSQLVARARVSRRRVLGILRALEAWTDRAGDDVRLHPAASVELTEWLGPAQRYDSDHGDQWDALTRAHGELVGRLGGFAAGLPRGLADLDHVPATAHTMAKRALHLADAYALADAHVLCVGDHDLTSLAVALVEPRASVTVVDVDDRVLGHIETVAAREGLAVTTAHADLRLGLPASLAGRADIVFTDPPYTPAGIGLFVRRGLEGLRRDRPTRVLFCYGFEDRSAGRALQVQEVVSDLRLALDAVHPQFNAYYGAEAIGGRSHLYVGRPTRTTWAAVAARSRAEARIYTRGSAAGNSPAADALAAPVVHAVAAVLSTGSGASEPSSRPVVLAGAGWPPAISDEFGPSVTHMDLAGYLAGGGLPAGVAAVNLHPHFGPSLPAVLFAAPPVLAVVLPRVSWRESRLANGGEPLGAFFGAGFEITTLADSRSADIAVIEVRRRSQPPTEPAARLWWYLIGHPGARVVNAWREGLVDLAATLGSSLAKNAARDAVSATRPGPALAELRLGELSASSLRELVGKAALSATTLAGRVEAN